MNTILLIAFGLVALSALIRLVLFFTAPKNHGESESLSAVKPYIAQMHLAFASCE